jgi:hypothetical protein
VRIGRASAILALALCSAGCGSTAPSGVAEVVPQIRALNGKTVRVAGYLGECAGYECRLFVDEAGWKEFQRAVDRLTRSREPQRWPVHLGIGVGDKFDFDKKAASFTSSYVVITGRITDQCRDDHNEPGCLDRSTDLEPTNIQSWSQPKPAETPH